MIQRIQTVWMALAVVFTIACLCMQIGAFSVDGLTVVREYNLWLIDDNASEHQFSTWPMFAVLVPSAALGIYSIFSYSNRKVQARFCMFNVLLLVGWYILYVVYSRILGGGEADMDFSPAVAAGFPAVAVILYVMARRSILADEALVRAADRIR